MRRIIPPDQIPGDVLQKSADWQSKRGNFSPAEHGAQLLALFREIARTDDSEWKGQSSLFRILTRFPREGKGPYSKANLIAGYHFLVAEGDLDADPVLLRRIRMKPTRTQSGVAPVTVLTAPAGCPGKCIFCPDDWRMPKSYIFDEPGCQRAERDGFDPFQQTLGRIRAFQNTGHETGKVELLILGGTWSAYGRDYREWFVQRCFDAMNAAGDPALAVSTSLAQAQERNVTARHRNVGLVIETRPDWITPEEIVHLRTLGVTKVQIGVQSLDDAILAANKRGHDVAEVRRALGLLRTAGFKLQLHWMPNLYGATLAADRADFARFFDDPAIRPDELKIYPCSLIAGTELYALWQEGKYQPYTLDELVTLLADVKPLIPPFTRVNRLFRDIPAHHIQAGVRASNLRQIVHQEMARRGTRCGCIRCREVQQTAVHHADLTLRVHEYATDLTREVFLEYLGAPESVESAESGDPATGARIAGFLRLSLPNSPTAGSRAFLPELQGNAMIREVHVYGQALSVGSGGEQGRTVQHGGLGTRLIEEACRISQSHGCAAISVISATGTQEYYAARGFMRGALYMTRPLADDA